MGAASIAGLLSSGADKVLPREYERISEHFIKPVER
jgi:hypothetical protein